MASGKGRSPRESLTDEGPWQVALAPDDIKVVSLDRLDDLYRLGIIDESTRIRGPGMTDWQPLGVAAGIGSAPAPQPPEPPASSIPDVPPARRARTSGRWIVVSAFVAGAIVASYRNDLVHGGARAVGLERAFLRLEAALGGPGFGTPRAVERLTER
jgi:hypothetical protein